MKSLPSSITKFAALCVCAVLYMNTVKAQTPEPVVSVVFAGDIMLEGGPQRAIRRGRDPFAGVAHLFKGADIRLGNLECVVATVGSVEPEKPNVFRVHPRALNHVRRHFDAVGLANNHSGDYGPQAFAQMLALLKQSGLGYYGGGHDLKEAHRPLILERQGIRIAILGYNEFQPRNFEADHDRPGVAWSEDEQVVRDIQDARRVWNADVVIPVMHWGWEEPMANARQRALARLMIDAGADAVMAVIRTNCKTRINTRANLFFIVWATLCLKVFQTR